MAGHACIIRQSSYPGDLLVRREAETLQREGFKVDVICQRFENFKTEEVINGVQVHRIPVMRKNGGVLRYLLSYGLFFLLVSFKLLVLHILHPFALIQVNTMPDFLVFTTLMPRIMGAKVGLFMYEPMPELWATLYHRPGVVKALEYIQKYAIAYAHVVFAVTEEQKQTFVARGADAHKIHVILNVPETCIWEQYVCQETPRTENTFVLMCHGAIEERYGHDLMLQAVQTLKDRIPEIRLRITGFGTHQRKFLAQVKAMGLEPWVQYDEWLPLPQLVAEICRADIGIVAQKSSRYSNLVHTGKMYDFLSFGKPVVASRLKSVRAYFSEDALCFFEPGSAESLANAIWDLYQHPDKRTAMAQKAQRLYEQYCWSNQKEIYLSAYRRLLAPSWQIEDSAIPDVYGQPLT